MQKHNHGIYSGQTGAVKWIVLVKL